MSSRFHPGFFVRLVPATVARRFVCVKDRCQRFETSGIDDFLSTGHCCNDARAAWSEVIRFGVARWGRAFVADEAVVCDHVSRSQPSWKAQALEPLVLQRARIRAADSASRTLAHRRRVPQHRWNFLLPLLRAGRVQSGDRSPGDSRIHEGGRGRVHPSACPGMLPPRKATYHLR